MTRPISWNFYKVILQQDLAFEKKKEIMVERFENADTYVREWRDITYRYQLYDVEKRQDADSGRVTIIGHLTRSPKTAYGRSLNEKTRISEEDSVGVEEIADYTEFIYDLDSCVLSLHRRAPFTGVKTMVAVWLNLLGLPYDEDDDLVLDVHVESMRDEGFTEEILETEEPLRRVKLTFAKPNPGKGDDILGEIDLGLIGEDTDSDEMSIDARRKSGGSLKKSGFFLRSIRELLGKGYLKKGYLWVADKKYDLLTAKEKERQTEGYYKDDDNQPLPLPELADLWFRQLERENDDIFPPN